MCCWKFPCEKIKINRSEEVIQCITAHVMGHNFTSKWITARLSKTFFWLIVKRNYRNRFKTIKIK